MNNIKCPACNNKNNNIISIDDCDIDHGLHIIQYYTCSCGCKFSEKYVYQITTIYKVGEVLDIED